MDNCTKCFKIFPIDFLDTTQGYIRIASCSNCDIAWLYKDAHRFGLEEYRALIGDYNILCPRTNSGSAIAVLDRQDSDFVALMNSCPDSGKRFELLIRIIFLFHKRLKVYKVGMIFSYHIE